MHYGHTESPHCMDQGFRFFILVSHPAVGLPPSLRLSVEHCLEQNSGVSSSSHLPLISSIAFLGSACFSHFQDYIFKTVQIHIKWLEMRSTGAEFNLAKCMNSVSRMTERDASFLKKKTNARLLIKFLFVLNGYERARLFGCACCCQGNEHSPEYCSY